MGKGTILVVMAIALVVSGCGAAVSQEATPSATPIVATMVPAPVATPSPTLTPPPTPTYVVGGGDCGLTPTVTAWIDLDQDGMRDLPDEPPLAGVTFVVDHPFSRWSAKTDASGEHRFYIFPIPCPGSRYVLRAEVPVGYRATTPTSIEVNGSKFFEVGFMPLP